MKRLYSLLTILLVLSVLSCRKDEQDATVTEQLTASLSFLSSDFSSATINVSSTGAVDLAYLFVTDNTVPSARGIITAGTHVDVPGANVVFSDLTQGETYLLAAAAVSESGSYSDVVTLEFSTDGVNCSFDLSVLATTDELVSYTVTPSVDNVGYWVDVVELAEYGDADDASISAVVSQKLQAAANAAGASLSEYLLYGEHTGYVDGLSPETGYLLVVYGVSSEDASAITPLTRLEIQTTETKAEVTFELEYTDLTDASVNLKVTPSDDTATYVVLCEAAATYPNYTADDADAIAQSYVESLKTQLDKGTGLYTGTWTLNNVELVKDTEYYFYAFAYTPGVGISSACKLVSFKSDRGIWVEDFSATITVNSAQTTVFNFTVSPDTGYTGIYYGYVVLPTADYSDDAAIEKLEEEITEYYEQMSEEYAEWGYSFSYANAVSYVCNTGTRTFTVSGLSSNTEYTIAVIAVEEDGTAKKVLTQAVTTREESYSDATCTAELVAFFDGRSMYNSGNFSDLEGVNGNLLYKGLSVYKLTASEDAAECWFYLKSGDYSDANAENSADDYLLAQIEADSFFYQANDSMYAFITMSFIYDSYWPTNYHIGTAYTFLSIAKDASGEWGRFDRQYTSGFSFADISDLKYLQELVEEVGAENVEISWSAY